MSWLFYVLDKHRDNLRPEETDPKHQWYMNDHLILADGTRISVQAGDGYHCKPQENFEESKNYTHFEVAGEVFDYSMVSVDVLKAYISEHGGVKGYFTPPRKRSRLNK